MYIVVNIVKRCHPTGVWAGRNISLAGNRTAGYTHYQMCMNYDLRHMLINLGPENLKVNSLFVRT